MVSSSYPPGYIVVITLNLNRWSGCSVQKYHALQGRIQDFWKGGGPLYVYKQIKGEGGVQEGVQLSAQC